MSGEDKKDKPLSIETLYDELKSLGSKNENGEPFVSKIYKIRSFMKDYKVDNIGDLKILNEIIELLIDKLDAYNRKFDEDPLMVNFKIFMLSSQVVSMFYSFITETHYYIPMKIRHVLDVMFKKKIK
jgi:hypothetical protein